MGLGLFIAKTLLERTGAMMSFANASESAGFQTKTPQRRGAVVEAIWPRGALAVDRSAALGDNQVNI
jgi:two-component system sensor histidine kinase RegB